MTYSQNGSTHPVLLRLPAPTEVLVLKSSELDQSKPLRVPAAVPRAQRRAETTRARLAASVLLLRSAAPG